MLQFNRFKTKFRNAPLLNKAASPPNNGGAAKKMFSERKVIVVGEQGSFISSLLTSVFVQFECPVTYLSLIVAHSDTDHNIPHDKDKDKDKDNNNNDTINSSNNNNNINTITINMSKCWTRSGPNMCATVNQDELARVMGSMAGIMCDADFVVICCEWAEYRQLFDQLDVLSRCCKSASVKNAIVTFPMGVEDESISQLSSSNGSSGSNGKSIESIFEGVPTTFLFYSALMQWLFMGPPNNADHAIELANINTSSINAPEDGGCYWLDCDDLIKIIVEIVRQAIEKDNSNGSSSSNGVTDGSTSPTPNNRMYIITGGECLTSKDISLVLSNELHMTTLEYKGDRGDAIAKFYQYLKSPISTIQSPDIEVFLTHRPTTFAEFIAKCHTTQFIELSKRKPSLTGLNNNNNNNVSQDKDTSNSPNLSTSSGSSTSSTSTSSTNEKNAVLGSPPSPQLTTTTTTTTNTTVTPTASTATATATATTSALLATSITLSAIKLVSSPFTFLKYSKTLIEETIYKSPVASKKKDGRDRETDLWISLLTTGLKKMLDANNSFDDQPITDTDYQKETTYEFLDENQSNWTLTSYAPKIFDNIRNFYLIDNFLKSNDNNNGTIGFEQVKTIGRSGSFFFQSTDGRYFLKTIPSNEFLTFIKILPSYCQHIQKYSNNLLPRFYGLYRLKGKLLINNNNSNGNINGNNVNTNTNVNGNVNSNENGTSNSSSSNAENGGSATNLDQNNNNNNNNSNSGFASNKDVIFIIMENLFYTNPVVELHERYDLKGSTVGRYVEVDELEDLSLHTLKDLNLKSKLYIGPYKKLLVAQLEVDTEWLLNHSICDYSLLVGIHLGSANKDKSKVPPTPALSPTKDISFFKKDFNGILSSTSKPIHVIPIRNGKTAIPPIMTREDSVTQVRFSAMSIEDENHNADSEHSDSSLGEQEEEAIKYEEGTVYYLGLIDTLTTYDMKKRGEHAIKSVLFDKTQISAVGPKDYRSRFIKYIQTIIE